MAQDRYAVTSPADIEYNCVAWAVQDTERWWYPDPDYYWPNDSYELFDLAAYSSVFTQLGFGECPRPNVEREFEKLALFTDKDGRFTHVARQLPSGRWTSKLGDWEDIEHDLFDLEGDFYGQVARIMKRRIQTPP